MWEKSSARVRQRSLFEPAFFSALPHPGSGGSVSHSVGRDEIDDAKIERFLTGVDRAARDDLFRQGRSSSAREQRDRAHSGEGVKCYFAETKLCTLFDDQEIGHQCTLEASAKVLTIQGRERYD
jgi:hypothetical protein